MPANEEKNQLVKNDNSENIELYKISTAIHRVNTHYKCYLNRVTNRLESLRQSSGERIK